MSGGAIITDFIPAHRYRRLTADFLWPDLKKWSGDHSKGQAGSEAVADNGFEADFHDFKDEVDADVEPFAFSATASKPRHHRDGDLAAKALPLLCCCFRDSMPQLNPVDATTPRRSEP